MGGPQPPCIAQSASTSAVSAPTAPPPRSLCAACTRPPSPLRRPLPCYERSSGVLWGVEGMTEHQPVLGLHVGHGRKHPLRPRRGGTSIKGSCPGGPGGGAPRRENSGFFTFTRIFHARRRRGTPRASDASCVSAVERPRERLPCRPPGRLRAGAPLQPASWPHRWSSLLSKLFPFIRAAAVGRSRPAESSTSLFDWASRAPQALRK